MKTPNRLLLLLSAALLVIVTSFSIRKTTLDLNPRNEKEGNKKFEEFLSNFDALPLPYSIEQEELAEYFNVNKKKTSRFDGKKRIDSKFQDFVPGMQMTFSRKGPDTYIYEGIVTKSKTSTTLIYSAHSPFRSNYPKFYILSYDASGNITNKKRFAYRTQERLTEGLVDEALSVIIVSYALDFYKDGFSYDSVIDESKLQLDDILTLKITSKGMTSL